MIINYDMLVNDMQPAAHKEKYCGSWKDVVCGPRSQTDLNKIKRSLVGKLCLFVVDF